MPLVDYGSSDESDTESSDEKKGDYVKKVDCFKKNEDCPVQSSAIVKPTSDNLNAAEDKLFAQLPVPKSTYSLGEDALKLLSRNKNQPVKILLPSLSDLESGDNEEIKKKKPSSKGSGLFALLPAPKNVNNFIPKSITKKLNHSNKPKSVPVIKQSLFTESNPVEKCNIDEDDEHEVNPSSFFFSSSDDIVLPEAEISECFSGLETVKTENSSTDNLSAVNLPVTNYDASSGSRLNIFSDNESDSAISETQNNQDFSNLDDEAIEKLCGTRARKRKGEIPDEVIDINVDSMVGDAYMWLSKDLSKEQEHRGYKKAKNLSVVERRKHQITYLASQAKEKEMELRNQWANSRMTRKQTQSKYGF